MEDWEKDLSWLRNKNYENVFLNSYYLDGWNNQFLDSITNLHKLVLHKNFFRKWKTDQITDKKKTEE